jgi:hypothetical protein
MTLYAVIVGVFLYVVLKFMFKVYPAGLAGECAFLLQIFPKLVFVVDYTRSLGRGFFYMFHTVGYVTDDVIAAQFQALHQVVDGNSLSLGGIIQVDTPPILLFKFDYNLTAQLKQTNFIKLGKKKYKKKIKNPLQNYEG